jgi:aminopeptidase N
MVSRKSHFHSLVIRISCVPWYRNTDADHYWLNEGWTVYMERAFQQRLHNAAHRGLAYVIGKKSLDDAWMKFEDTPKYRKLVIDFDVGEDPDAGFSSIIYEKGANFLFYLGLFRARLVLWLLLIVIQQREFLAD